MEKIKIFLNRKTIIYLSFFIIFSFFPLFKASAADILLGMKSSGPANGSVTTSKDTPISISFTYPMTLSAIPTAPNLNFNVLLRVYCDGAYLGENKDFYPVRNIKKNTMPAGSPGTGGINLPAGICPVDTKIMSWELFAVNDTGTILSKYTDSNPTPNVSYAINTNYAGFYYIYQKPNGTYYLFSVGDRYTDLASCNASASSFVANDSSYTIYRACKYYDSIPATDTAEFKNIAVLAGQGTSDFDSYTLLAPLPGMTDKAPDNYGDYVNIMIKLVIGLCGTLAVIMIVIGGIQYMGDESIFGKTEAKKQITNAILGLLIALGAWVLLNTINPDLLKGSVTIKSVSAGLAEPPMLTESGGLPAKGQPLGTKELCLGGYGDVTGAGGQVVMHTCATIATNVSQMLKDAAAAVPPIMLTGSSFRSAQDQIDARIANKCPDVYNSPPSACNPPTAKPGTSMHEGGLAIDFKCNGDIIKSTDNACFIWLQANASKYGLKNFSKEPWHWSTNGK